MNKQQYIAKYDFVGDASLHQLSFVRNTVIDVKLGQRLTNGWLWGSCYGEKGWFPAWAIAYDEVQRRHIHEGPLGMECNPEMRQTQTPEGNISVSPQEPSFTTSAEESSGFDQATNNIMGGNIPTNVENLNESCGKNPFHGSSGPKESPSLNTTSHGSFFNTFRKPKINPFPFQQERPKTPEWTPEPQIIYEGKVFQEPAQNKKRGLFHHLQLR